MRRSSASSMISAACLVQAGWRLALACILGLALSGCAGGGQGTFAGASGPGGSIAFESVDGPPPQVFDRLVRNIESEARSRNLIVVGREAPAAYRVRSYLSAQVQRNTTTIAWVWDVYDANQQRALRLSGSEPAGKAGRDAWAGADDQLLRRIAQAGTSGLASLVNGGAPASAPVPAQEAPSTGNPAVASSDSEGMPTNVASLGSGPTMGFAAH